jgi:hypothetical protein
MSETVTQRIKKRLQRPSAMNPNPRFKSMAHVSPHHSSTTTTPAAFPTHLCNHARRLRLKNYCIQNFLETPTGTLNFNPLLDPGGGFASETAVRDS